MNNTYGDNFRLTIFGASHADKIGVTIEGIPVGFAIDEEALRNFMKRRAPGQSTLTTARREPDEVVFERGVDSNMTVCSQKVEAVIYNTNVRKSDYSNLRDIPRPGHADYTARRRYGDDIDLSGGGAFSGRMTAPLCIAGGIALQILRQEGITVSAKALSIAGETDPGAMEKAVLEAAAQGDSVGGVVHCEIHGVPAGIGDPMFYGIENRIAQIVFGIPAVKGIEFGAGFESARLKGSENNDAFYSDEGTVRTRTNNAGGILGGITNGMPVTFNTAFKPTPSIAKEQDSVDLKTGENTKLAISGRHDPCIVPRAIPVVEAAAAAAILDALYERRKTQ